MTSQIPQHSANRCSSAVATMAGANIVAAPGAGKRIRILACWISASDDASTNTGVQIQVTVGAAPKIAFQALLLTAPPALPMTAGISCDLLCDENTAVVATAIANSGNRNAGIHYRVENGSGTD